MPASRHACGVSFPLAIATSICRRRATICSGLCFFLAIFQLLSYQIFSHFTWYKIRRSRQVRVAKTTPIPSYVLPLSKARIASARILSTTVVLEQSQSGCIGNRWDTPSEAAEEVTKAVPGSPQQSLSRNQVRRFAAELIALAATLLHRSTCSRSILTASEPQQVGVPPPPHHPMQNQ